MRNGVLLATISLSFLSLAAAEDLPNVNGTWQIDMARSQGVEAKVKGMTLVFHQTGEEVSMTETITENDGKERKLDLQCKTDGNRCKTKIGSASLWYDATALLIMEERKNVVLRRRFQPSEDGKSLAVEITQMAPPGQKPSTLAFVKQADAGQ